MRIAWSVWVPGARRARFPRSRCGSGLLSGHELRVYPPGQTTVRHAFFPVQGITIDRAYLEIGPVEPGF